MPRPEAVIKMKATSSFLSLRLAIGIDFIRGYWPLSACASSTFSFRMCTLKLCPCGFSHVVLCDTFVFLILMMAITILLHFQNLLVLNRNGKKPGFQNTKGTFLLICSYCMLASILVGDFFYLFHFIVL